MQINIKTATGIARCTRVDGNRIRVSGPVYGLRGQLVGQRKGWIADERGEPIAYSGLDDEEFGAICAAALGGSVYYGIGGWMREWED